MRVLFDTHVLLWKAIVPKRIPDDLRAIMDDTENEFLFSVASIWEVAIKQSLGKDDFEADPSVLRRELIEEGYVELPVLGEHAIAVSTLPLIHRDPFDRLLVAQAIVEGVELLTADARLAGYPGPIRVF